MKTTWYLGCMLLVLLCGCSSLSSRKHEDSAAFSSLSPAQQELVRRGRIEQGMDTNAVQFAFGKPSEVLQQPSATGSGTDEVWLYYGDRPVLVPRWTNLPDPYGYWTPQYTPGHYSQRYTKAEVHFRNGRVVDWKTY